MGEGEKERRKTQDAGRRTQGKPEGESGRVGEGEKERRKTQDTRRRAQDARKTGRRKTEDRRRKTEGISERFPSCLVHRSCLAKVEEGLGVG